MTLQDHPTVRRVSEAASKTSAPAAPLDAEWLRELCLACGADDAGFVAIDRPELDDQREHITALFPSTRTLIALVARMNPESVRSTARSAANLEFHEALDDVNGSARRIVRRLADEGVRAVNAVSAFPMEMDRFPGRVWTVSHKPVAVAAGLGRMGIHRSVIHPKHGSFILLGTILIDQEVTADDAPIDYNPCLECKLCVAACPVGALSPDGDFAFSACMTHNYREFMSGFTDWVEQVVEAKDMADYRGRVADNETVSMWQSLSFKPNYKAAYCIAVCPAGEDIIGPFLEDRKGFKKAIVDPLVEKEETLYVTSGSDAVDYVAKRFPHKSTKIVGSGMRVAAIDSFIFGMGLRFQRRRAAKFNGRFHISFTGESNRKVTALIENGKLEVTDGLNGEADVSVEADAATWLRAINGEISMIRGIVTRKIRVKGPLKKFRFFGSCFA